MRFLQVASLALVGALSACSVQGVTFVSTDSGSGADGNTTPDGVPGVVTIVASDPALTVTEGMTKTFTVALSAEPLTGWPL